MRPWSGPAPLRDNIRKGVFVMSEDNRLRHLADCWRRLAEVDSQAQKSYRLAWADYLDCLVRLEDRPESTNPGSHAKIGAR